MLDRFEADEGVSVPPGAAPLEFSVRVSARSRRVRLSVTAREGLVVVVPRGWRGDAEAIVESKRTWAERALASVASRRTELLAGPEASLPSRIELRALGRVMPVEYRHTSARGVTACTRGASVVVSGDVGDAGACIEALRRWLSRTAQAELPGFVADEADRSGLQPKRVRVTTARTRWGSCSARGTLSLHRNALFLPEHLARALVLHELAHLSVLDHSPRFWALLASLDPHALEHRGQLKRSSCLVPAWVDV